MIDYDDSEVMWSMHEIEYIVCGMQSDWEEITVESVARGVHNLYGEQDTVPSDQILEMCDYYLQRYSDPFDGLGDVPSDLKILTETGKNSLFKAVTTKSKQYKDHAAKLDDYINAKFGDSMVNPTG